MPVGSPAGSYHRRSHRAFVVGYVVIIGFLKFVSTFSYKAFAIYRIGLAIVVALLLITRRAFSRWKPAAAGVNLIR